MRKEKINRIINYKWNNVQSTFRKTMNGIKKVFSSEEKDFTVWLSKNFSKLKPFIKSEIISYETEKNIEGKFLDILAKDQEGKKIAIENQFGISNFDHLGKIISYCTSIKADKGVWITEKFHPIHIEALHWLNSVNSSIEFIAISVVNPLTNQAGDRNKIEFKEPILYNEVNIGDILDARNRNKVEIDDTLKKLIELYNDEFPRGSLMFMKKTKQKRISI